METEVDPLAPSSSAPMAEDAGDLGLVPRPEDDGPAVGSKKRAAAEVDDAAPVKKRRVAAVYLGKEIYYHEPRDWTVDPEAATAESTRLLGLTIDKFKFVINPDSIIRQRIVVDMVSHLVLVRDAAIRYHTEKRCVVELANASKLLLLTFSVLCHRVFHEYRHDIHKSLREEVDSANRMMPSVKLTLCSLLRNLNYFKVRLTADFNRDDPLRWDLEKWEPADLITRAESLRHSTEARLVLDAFVDDWYESHIHEKAAALEQAHRRGFPAAPSVVGAASSVALLDTHVRAASPIVAAAVTIAAEVRQRSPPSDTAGAKPASPKKSRKPRPKPAADRLEDSEGNPIGNKRTTRQKVTCEKNPLYSEEVMGRWYKKIKETLDETDYSKEIAWLFNNADLKFAREICYDPSNPADVEKCKYFNRIYDTYTEALHLWMNDPTLEAFPDEILQVMKDVRVPNADYASFREITKVCLGVDLPVDGSQFRSFETTPGLLTPLEALTINAMVKLPLKKERLAEKDICIRYAEFELIIEAGQPIPQVLFILYNIPEHATGMAYKQRMQKGKMGCHSFTKMEQILNREHSPLRYLISWNISMARHFLFVKYDGRANMFHFGHADAFENYVEGRLVPFDTTTGELQTANPASEKEDWIPIKPVGTPCIRYDEEINGLKLSMKFPRDVCLANLDNTVFPANSRVGNLAGIITTLSSGGDMYHSSVAFKPKENVRDPGKDTRVVITPHPASKPHRSCQHGMCGIGHFASGTCCPSRYDRKVDKPDCTRSRFDETCMSGIGMLYGHYFTDPGRAPKNSTPENTLYENPFYKTGNLYPITGLYTTYDWKGQDLIDQYDKELLHRARSKCHSKADKDAVDLKSIPRGDYVFIDAEWQYEKVYTKSRDQLMSKEDYSDPKGEAYMIQCLCTTCCRYDPDGFHGAIWGVARPHWSTTLGVMFPYGDPNAPPSGKGRPRGATKDPPPAEKAAATTKDPPPAEKAAATTGLTVREDSSSSVASAGVRLNPQPGGRKKSMARVRGSHFRMGGKNPPGVAGESSAAATSGTDGGAGV